MVFSALQLSWFSVEQAWAVTEDQWAELNAEQKLAVQRARYEGDILLEPRGVHTKIYIIPLQQVSLPVFICSLYYRFFCFSFEVVFFTCGVKVNKLLSAPNPSREELGCCCADCRMFACAFAGCVPLSMAHSLED